MKYLMILIVLFAFVCCRQEKSNSKELQAQIGDLQHKLDNAYKPGFGEFMSSVQVHHNKLWFAGTNNNWKLADFEINEIKESLDDIKTYCTNRPETKSIGMIEQPLQGVSDAIRQKDLTEFKNSYITLTSACNSCHRATQHEFNIITVPTTPPYSNQSFKPIQ